MRKRNRTKEMGTLIGVCYLAMSIGRPWMEPNIETDCAPQEGINYWALREAVTGAIDFVRLGGTRSIDYSVQGVDEAVDYTNTERGGAI